MTERLRPERAKELSKIMYIMVNFAAKHNMLNFQNLVPKEFSIENIKFEEKFYLKVCRILPLDKGCQVIIILKPRQRKVLSNLYIEF